MSTKELKPLLLLITYAGAVFLTVTHLDRILSQISWITSVIMPFTIALVIAFVLNRPYKLIRYRVYTPLLQKAGLSEKKAGSISSVLSILSVYFLLFFLTFFGRKLVVCLTHTHYLNKLKIVATMVANDAVELPMLSISAVLSFSFCSLLGTMISHPGSMSFDLDFNRETVPFI